MKLATARVQNFRSIEDSTEFRIEDDITCLVGKNEAGKTALLTALYRTNPIFQGEDQFVRKDDYPRRFLSDFDERHPDGDPIVVTTSWTLEDSEKNDLAARLGAGAVKVDEFSVHRGYGNLTFGSPTIDEDVVVAHLLATSELHEEEKKQLAAHRSVDALRKAIGSPDAASPRLAELAQRMDEQFPNGSVRSAFWSVVELPKFMLFSQYQRMQGQVSLQEILARKTQKKLDKDDQVFLALCDLAGVTLEEAAGIQHFEELVASFEGASNKISQEIFKYWTQNRFLKVVFRLDHAQPGDPVPFNKGNIVRTRIENRLHEVTVPFDQRSTGFVWFFSFLALFSQVKKRHTGRLILLLDEPGLSLHGKAQQDLLRYFRERLVPHHQVVYTTHSPFMVPTENLLAARTVEDVLVERPGHAPDVKGTKVGSDVLSTDKDTLFPLQTALGYEISQTLFVGEHSLVVEGPSDLLYLKCMSEELRAVQRTVLDRRWTICPAEGIDKVPAFLSLFGGNKLHVAVLADFASGQKKKVEEIRKSQLLRSGHVLTADTYAGHPEADTEDILGADTYVELVNACYELKGKQAVGAPPAGKQVLKHVEEHFKTLPAEVPEFDHFTPASYLVEHRAAFFRGKGKAGLGDALDRFERLFKDLNALLP